MRRVLVFFLCFCVVIALFTYGGEKKDPFSFQRFFEECAELPSRPDLPDLKRDWKTLLPIMKPSLPADPSIWDTLVYIRDSLRLVIPVIVNGFYNMGTVFEVLYDILCYVWQWLVYIVDCVRTFVRACQWSL